MKTGERNRYSTPTDRNGAPTLSDVSGPRLTPPAPNAGSYAVARLIERYGDVTLIWLRAHVSADCP